MKVVTPIKYCNISCPLSKLELSFQTRDPMTQKEAGSLGEKTQLHHTNICGKDPPSSSEKRSTTIYLDHQRKGNTETFRGLFDIGLDLTMIEN